MTENNSNTIKGSVTDNNLNINNPNISISISDSAAKSITSSVNNLAGVLSATGGASLGYKIAKNIPGSPCVKL